ncbi:MAG: LysM peptidoglycan-binding domain-containing protein [Saprospiraceae bacterium]|nr:LysM peptidoglycan-binding domain-containing protein [Saprospiraceae bacterium]
MNFCLNIICFIFFGLFAFRPIYLFAEDLNDQVDVSSLDYVFSSKQSDSLFVRILNGQQYLIHSLQSGQTLYSLKNFYGVDLSDIYRNNPSLDPNDLSIGQKICIPIANKAIHLFLESETIDNMFIPIYYKVRSSETLYGISKMYFRLPLEIFRSRNKLISDELNEGQVLHVGWISKTGIPDSLKIFTGLSGVLAEESKKNKILYEEKLNGQNEKLLEGTACWDKTMDLSSANKLYVLCSKVIKGGIVRIENPMTKRFLYAKVVAQKPENSFSQSSIVMLTPTVAEGLGGLDARFYVKMYYCQ